MLPHDYIKEGTFLHPSEITDDEVEEAVRKSVVRVSAHPRHQ